MQTVVPFEMQEERALQGPQALERSRHEDPRGWRGRKTDFEVLSDGVRPIGSVPPSELCPWSTLPWFSVDEAGLVLEFEHRYFQASVYADNYWSLAFWLKSVSASL